VARQVIWRPKLYRESNIMDHLLIYGLQVFFYSASLMATSHSRAKQMLSCTGGSKEAATRWLETTFQTSVWICLKEFWMLIRTLDLRHRRYCKITGLKLIRGKSAPTTKYYSNSRHACYSSCLHDPRSRLLFVYRGIRRARMAGTLRLELRIRVQIRRVIAWTGSWLKQRVPPHTSPTSARFKMWTMRLYLLTTIRRQWTKWWVAQLTSSQIRSSVSTLAYSYPSTSNGSTSWILSRWAWLLLRAGAPQRRNSYTCSSKCALVEN